MALKLVKKKVNMQWNSPGANLKQVKDFLASVEDAPENARIVAKSYFWTGKIKWIEIVWEVGNEPW